jgi:hypothetical protein
MELAKPTESLDRTWNLEISPVDRRDDSTVDSSTINDDVARAWELKAGLQWARNDRGPVNGFRWLLWDRFGMGRPPSGVEQRPTPRQPESLSPGTAAGTPTLHLVTSENGPTSGIRPSMNPPG